MISIIVACLLALLCTYSARVLIKKQCEVEGLSVSLLPGILKTAITSTPFGYIDNEPAAKMVPSKRLVYVGALGLLALIQYGYVLESILRWLPIPRFALGPIAFFGALFVMHIIDKSMNKATRQNKI